MAIGWLVFLGEALGGLVPVARATKRLVNAWDETEPPAPAEPPKPIGHGDYTDGLFDAAERRRSKQLGEQQTERARRQLDDGSDD
jgi:hypothetical protein